LPENLKKMVYHSRKSWDISVKIYVRNGLLDNLPLALRKEIHRSNIHRWINEPDDKYVHCEVAQFINGHITLLKKTTQSPKALAILEGYHKLSDTYHNIIADVKKIKTKINTNKQKIVEIIEQIKEVIPINEAIKIFNISRTTYHNYKTLVLNKCDASYFKWCLKQYPHQLLYREINQIKKYLTHIHYKYWSKSSVYLLALRNKDISFCLATFYKYATLLGYKSNRHLQPKIKYDPLTSTKSNEVWCADVTIVKTQDGKKSYVHFLMDHFSKKILGYKVENTASPRAIKLILQEAYTINTVTSPIQFVTDGGVENVNNTLKEFILSTNKVIIHKIAQKDITPSNSQIEAFNKIFKHQLIQQLFPTQKQFLQAMSSMIFTYNEIRPQLSLQGNTPAEVYQGKRIDISMYKTHFPEQKLLRKAQNQHNICKTCQ
jgi:putative transposase